MMPIANVGIESKFIRVNCTCMEFDFKYPGFPSYNLKREKEVDSYFRYLYSEGFIVDGQPYQITYKKSIIYGRFNPSELNY
jgi:hypothetical protein